VAEAVKKAHQDAAEHIAAAEREAAERQPSRLDVPQPRRWQDNLYRKQTFAVRNPCWILVDWRPDMSLLLHLSDLHLANTPTEDLLGDYKVEVVQEEDRVSRLRLLKNTLKALAAWLAENDTGLDGVIVTGDVTTRGNPAGFHELPGILGALETALPSPQHIVVVPGNHDVAWGTEPGSEERYRGFIEGVRAVGYVTPLLDGIDYVGDDPASGANPLFIGSDFVVAAVNSADMCGVMEPFQGDAAEEFERLAVAGVLSEKLQAQIRRGRTYDMPRISHRQMAALARLIDPIDTGLVRIVALHHHLVPVREEEEVKPFEAIVNLGAFNVFLGESCIDLVVHGHKHVPRVQTLPLTGPEAERRFAVVSSCGTIGGMVGIGHEIAKLIKIDSSLPTLRRVEILTVPAVNAGSKLRRKITNLYDKATWRASGMTPTNVVSGATATNVHEQLMEMARKEEQRSLHDVVCVIDQGPTALEPPTTYRWPEHDSPPLPDWFNDIVSWWQDPQRADGKPFTHGQRLRDWSGDQTCDQLKAIADILARDLGTSRGIAVLLNPDTDKIDNKSVDFPSFSLLHLWVSDGALHCSAFFRKQEMTFWWPVNAAELARIQHEAVQRLRLTHEHIAAGAIRTYASEAVFSDRLPKVDVPSIDREFWRNPAALRVLAVAVADGTIPGRSDDIATLLSFMDDWAPVAEAPPIDGAAVPVRGLGAIAEMLEALVDRYPLPAREVSEVLRDIEQANKAYMNDLNTGDPFEAYRQWRGRQQPKLARLRELLTSAAT
jgi:3',5'-cyclic AMP phosphodiesterase CpdA